MAPSLKSILSKAIPSLRSHDHLRALDQNMIDLIREIRSRRLTYLSEQKLAGLLKACAAAERDSVAGIFIEAGCALGGSAILIATCKADSRPFHVHDVFGMIPPPGAKDPPEVHDRYRVITSGNSTGIDGDIYYGYRTDIYDVVLANMLDFSISPEVKNTKLIAGLVQDTLHGDEPVALAHIDDDWHEPVNTCLRRIFPRLSRNGVIILDDYYDWGGCRSATDAFLKEIEGQFSLDNSFHSLIITRIST